jgi:hypothetical protein
MFPNAYRFISLLHRRLASSESIIADGSAITATDLMK